jgi:hypothetical protein
MNLLETELEFGIRKSSCGMGARIPTRFSSGEFDKLLNLGRQYNSTSLLQWARLFSSQKTSSQVEAKRSLKLS